MSSHHCLLRGTLALKPSVTPIELAQAFQPLVDLTEVDYDDLCIHHLDDDKIWVDDIQFWCAGIGFDISELDELAENLGPLVREPSLLVMIDDDTGADDKMVPYFIGQDDDQVRLAMIRCWLDSGREHIEEILGGREAFNAMSVRVVEMIEEARPLANGNPKDAQAPASEPLKYFAVTGRIPGDYEDSLRVFRAGSREEPSQLFQDAVWGSTPAAEREAHKRWVEQIHGKSLFINTIVMSETEISSL